MYVCHTSYKFDPQFGCLKEVLNRKASESSTTLNPLIDIIEKGSEMISASSIFYSGGHGTVMYSVIGMALMSTCALIIFVCIVKKRQKVDYSVNDAGKFRRSAEYLQ